MAHNYDHAVVKYMGREGAKYAEGGAKLGSPPPLVAPLMIMNLNSPINLEHDNWAVNTDPFHY